MILPLGDLEAEKPDGPTQTSDLQNYGVKMDALEAAEFIVICVQVEKITSTSYLKISGVNSWGNVARTVPGWADNICITCQVQWRVKLYTGHGGF